MQHKNKLLMSICALALMAGCGTGTTNTNSTLNEDPNITGPLTTLATTDLGEANIRLYFVDGAAQINGLAQVGDQGKGKDKSETGVPTATSEVIDSAIVKVDKIEIQNTEASWIEIPTSEALKTDGLDLVNLQNGVSAVLGDANLEPGIYNQLRVTLAEDGATVAAGGESYPLKVASGTLKLNLNHEIKEGEKYGIVLGWNAQDALKRQERAGSDGKEISYLLTPQVKVKDIIKINADGSTESIEDESDTDADEATEDPDADASEDETA